MSLISYPNNPSILSNATNVSEALFLKNTLCFSQENLEIRIDTVVCEILTIAQKYVEKKDEISGICRNIYRFDTKIKGRHLAGQWECFYKTNLSPIICEVMPQESILGGILHLKEDAKEVTYRISQSIDALKIHHLILTEHTEKIDYLKCGLNSLLNGNQFEQIKLLKSNSLKVSYFDSWEREKEIYRSLIYPLCLAYTKKLIPPNGTVLELCGGDGELAELIFKQAHNKIKKYFIIDLNKKSKSQAEKILATQIKEGLVEYNQENVITVNYEEILIGQKVDFILGIGALTEQVLSSRKDAIAALQHATASLKIEGHILLTGLASSWIMSKDLEELGLQVINCSSPDEAHRYERVSECYLAQKLGCSSEVKPLWNFFNAAANIYS